MAVLTKVLLSLCAALLVSDALQSHAARLPRGKGLVRKSHNARPRGGGLQSKVSTSVNELTAISIKKAPYMVQLEDECEFIWEGVILNKNYILSTSVDLYTSLDYCDNTLEDITARVGTAENTGGSTHAISEVLVYPDDETQSEPLWANNVALYRLEKSLSFSDKVKPISIATGLKSVPSTVTVISYDLKLETDFTLPYLLRSAELDVYGRKKCKEYMSEEGDGTLPSELFCVNQPYSSVYLFSTGSPALNSKGELLGFNAGPLDGIYLFTNVSNPSVLSFINSVLDGDDSGVTVVEDSATLKYQ